MEYYQGFLIRATPAKADRRANSAEGPSKRVQKDIYMQIAEMKSRLKRIEKKYRLEETAAGGMKTPSPSKPHRPPKPSLACPPTPSFSEDLRLQNDQLRQENRLLNDYFNVFESKYAQQRRQIDKLRRENQSLRDTLTNNSLGRAQSSSTLQTPSEQSYRKLHASRIAGYALAGHITQKTTLKRSGNLFQEIDTPSKLTSSPSESVHLHKSTTDREDELLI